uniref:Transmembrane protein n=1 Tax=Steinernema glaseri TaxID=37863 RepID=A0A1I8AWZ1_9BILA
MLDSRAFGICVSPFALISYAVHMGYIRMMDNKNIDGQQALIFRA